MNIKTISLDDLYNIADKEGITEGLIIEASSDKLGIWVQGINEELTKHHILENGSLFEDVFTFKYNGYAHLFFPFDGVKVNMRKLSIWYKRINRAYSPIKAMRLSDCIRANKDKIREPRGNEGK